MRGYDGLNDIALALVLSAFSLIFMIVVVPLWPMAWNAELYMMSYLGITEPLHSLGTDVPTLVALVVCLIPTTIGALLAAIGIAGMERALQANIIAKSGKAVETAGDIDIVLLDKTGTITVGDRHATDFLPVAPYSSAKLAQLAALASAADQTPEGKSIVKVANPDPGNAVKLPSGAEFVAFSAQIRMSGIDINGRRIRKAASDAIAKFVVEAGGVVPPALEALVNGVASKGATPLVVADGPKVAGVVVLEDILKPNMKERFDRLRKMGLRTVMITGDNPLTAATIEVRLTPKEFDLLCYLAKNPGRVLTHRTLLSSVWGEAGAQQSEYLHVFINHLRKKIEPDMDSNRYIVTEKWVGYRFEPGAAQPRQ